MNTIDILVLILMGFLILNHSLFNTREGLENNEDNVTKLLKRANTLTLKNSHTIDTVNKAFLATLKDYQSLQKELKNVKKNLSLNNAMNHGHSSVPPAPKVKPATVPTPPKGKCPSKYLKINWPASLREALSTRQINSQVDMVWKPEFSKSQQNQNSTRNKIVGTYDLIRLIEMIGNQIQDTLQKKNF
jgi:hypothetical protein